MSEKYLHCLVDGMAYVSDCCSIASSSEVAVLPYEEGMRVIVRAELPNGVKRCVTVMVDGMLDGSANEIVDLASAGIGAKVVKCFVLEGLLNGEFKSQGGFYISEENDVSDYAASVTPEDDGGTPAELWASGIKNVPSALPSGSIPYLPMQADWYAAIECGDKRTEHRKQCKKYRKWFIEQHPVAVKLQCGYSNRQMVWEVVGAEDYDEDGIEILLGKRIS